MYVFVYIYIYTHIVVLNIIKCNNSAQFMSKALIDLI